MFLSYISYKRLHGPARVLARCGFQSSGIFVALWPTCVVLSRYVSSLIVFDWLPLRRGPRGLPSPRIFMFMGGMKSAFVPSPSRDLGVRNTLVVQCELLCLVDLNSDLYCLCGSLHGQPPKDAEIAEIENSQFLVLPGGLLSLLRLVGSNALAYFDLSRN